MDDQRCQTHVSLGVEVQDSIGTPFLDTVKWVNGLVSFRWPHICVKKT